MGQGWNGQIPQDAQNAINGPSQSPGQSNPLFPGLTSNVGTFGGGSANGGFNVGMGQYGGLQQGSYTQPPAAPAAAPAAGGQAAPTKPAGGATPAGGGTSGGVGGGTGVPSDLSGMPEFGGSGSAPGVGTGGGQGGGSGQGGAGSVYGYGGAATYNNSGQNGASGSGDMTQAQSDFFNGNHNITDPYQVNQNMNSNLASFGAQSVPGAAAFQQGLFNPGFNAAENSFLNSEGERQTRLLNGQMAQLGNKFGGTPFHSGYLNMGRELGAEAASNLGQSAQGLAINRQGVAAQQLARILGDPAGRTEAAQNVVPGMLGLINNLQTAPLQQGLGYLNGSPIMAPTIIPGAQSTSGSGGKK